MDAHDKELLRICENIIAVYAVKGDIRPLQVKLRKLLDEKEAREKRDAKPSG